MEQDAVALTRELIDAWNARDLDRLFASFDEHAVVRPDGNWPETPFIGVAAARQWWTSVADTLGFGECVIKEQHDLGDRCLMGIDQEVSSRSGVDSAYSWWWLTTWRSGRLICVEFFLDGQDAKAAVGLS